MERPRITLCRAAMLALAFGVGALACSLNPQPLPPGGGGDPGGVDLGASPDASASPADAADSGDDGADAEGGALDGGAPELRDSGAESGDGG